MSMSNEHSVFIALLVNRKAGNGKSSQLAAEVGSMLGGLEIAHTIFNEPWPDNLNFYTDIWIFGGDGTVNYFINFYNNLQQPFSFFPGGTGNDVAWKMHGKKDLSSLVNHLLITAPQDIDAGVCNGRLFLNSVGIGFDGEVLRSMHSIRSVGGHLGYLLAVLKNIFQYNEPFFSIQFDKLIMNKKYLLVNIANSSRTGGGFMISPLAEINDGWLDLVLVQNISKLKRIFYLPKVEKGLHLDMQEASHYRLRDVIISCENELPAQIDGELFYAKRFEINIIQNKFLVKY